MITQDEIAKLAREYAEDATKADAGDPNLSASDLNGIKRDVAEYAEEVISWLLRTHCIIKKSKLGEAYYIAKYNYDNAESDRDKELALAKKEMLDFIIPESTKEVEL